MEYKMLQKQEDVLQNPTSRKWGKLEAVTNLFLGLQNHCTQ